MKVSTRKLLALGYPVPPKDLNLADQTQFRSLVFWVEDQKIRHYKIEDRSALRDTKSDSWNGAFKKYLTDLKCPFDFSDANFVEEILDWLLGLAVSLEYSDNADRYKNQSSDEVIVEAKGDSTNHSKMIKSDNPLDKLDYESDDFKEGVGELAKLLNVAQHPDHLVTMQAVCSLIQNRLSLDAVDQANKANEQTSCGTQQKLSDFVSGLDSTGDTILDEAAKALRLLHVQELRHLQTDINETIVAVQKLTADPKTDERLGKIGYS